MATLAGISNFHKVPDLRRRVIFTLGMLAVYRIGVFVTVPGVDRNVMRQAVAKQSGLLTFFNMFTGGALENFSIFALGIMPYISASIIIQLMGMVYKPVDELRKEGEQGRRKLDQYTRYGTIALSIFQSFGIARLAESISSSETGGGIVIHPGLGFQVLTVITLTTGTAFLMWIGEQITERGVSNGISLLIFASIITGVPRGIAQYFAQHQGDMRPLDMALILAFIVGAIMVIAFFENGRRQIPIVYSRRQVGRRVYGGQEAHLPLKVNTAGTIPPSSLRRCCRSRQRWQISTSPEVRHSGTCSSEETGSSIRVTRCSLSSFAISTQTSPFNRSTSPRTSRSSRPTSPASAQASKRRTISTG